MRSVILASIVAAFAAHQPDHPDRLAHACGQSTCGFQSRPGDSVPVVPMVSWSMLQKTSRMMQGKVSTTGKKTVVLFPGASSVYVGMLRMEENDESFKELFQKMRDQVTSVLGYDLVDICLNGPAEKLKLPRHAYPAAFIGNMFAYVKLMVTAKHSKGTEYVFAGLDEAGEYAALCAARVLDFEVCLELVQLCADVMSKDFVKRKQLLLAVDGLEKPLLRHLVDLAWREERGDAVCVISQELFRDGYTVAGTERSIRALQEMAEKRGAIQAKVLKTAGAPHSPLMTDAQAKLNIKLKEVSEKMQAPAHSFYLSWGSDLQIDGKMPRYEPGKYPEGLMQWLRKQLVTPRRFSHMIQDMAENLEVEQWYECGPNRQLKATIWRIDQKIWKNMLNVGV